MTQLLFSEFLAAAERFATAEAQALQEWKSACNCSAPGERLECRDCPFSKKLGLLIQQKLAPNPEKVFAIILPLKPLDPYSESVKQQCLRMYQAGYSFEEIQYLNGIPCRRTLRDWLREVGLPERSAQYAEDVKQKCLQLYAERWTPQQIENETGVPADTITDWAYQKGVSRSSKYPEELKQRCLQLYKDGKDSTEIHKLTGIPAGTIGMWLRKEGITRSQKRYSLAEKRHCQALYLSGKSPKEIQTITGIKVVTIRSWIRKENWSRGKK